MPSPLPSPDLEAFRALVRRYHTLVHEVIRRIEAQYGAAHIEDVLEDRVPWVGELPGLTFHFHGLGFTAVLDGYTVKWDWLGDSMNDINIWALAQLTQDHEAEFGVWASYPVLLAYARRWAEEGVLEAVEAGHTYRFTDDG
ncbi:DUF6896 domain-containing protein [Deinococcus sonorensis]|uniref:DUF6896 domain-containing protein n=2 Tax=Deinococcus sonorensis TaxID=309891 RepID=A0AAU7UGE7_9DEIO